MKAMWPVTCWIRMGKALEAKFLGKSSMVLDVWYYCCAYVLYVVHDSSMMLCACSVMYIYSVYMLFMKCDVRGGIDIGV